MRTTILDELREIRRLSQMTQNDLAEKAGLTRMTVQRVEGKSIDPRLSTIEIMARALGLELLLVPTSLKPELDAFVRSGGKLLGQPAGIGAPLSIVDELLAKSTKG
jgi:transcriptional regulator with XRE-family HTH domain